MKTYYKFISILFHPILLPIIVTILFFILHNINLDSSIKLKIIILIAVGTYFVPLTLLLLLKKSNFIKSIELSSIPERKIPTIFMSILFIILGKSLGQIDELLFLSMLFFGCSIALAAIYILFIFKIKTSLHVLGASTLICFIGIYSITYKTNLTFLLATIFIISGVIAQARLKLEQHNLNEVILGFLIGFVSQLWIYHKTLLNSL